MKHRLYLFGGEGYVSPSFLRRFLLILPFLPLPLFFSSFCRLAKFLTLFLHGKYFLTNLLLFLPFSILCSFHANSCWITDHHVRISTDRFVRSSPQIQPSLRDRASKTETESGFFDLTNHSSREFRIPENGKPSEDVNWPKIARLLVQ